MKAAQEVTRILRDQMRAVIEYGGLSMQSFIDFQSNVRGRINRIEAGPPPLRSQQLLALLDAGMVKIPFGPHPDVIASPTTARRTSARRRLTEPLRPRSTTWCGAIWICPRWRVRVALLSRLYTKGRLTQFSYGDTGRAVWHQ